MGGLLKDQPFNQVSIDPPKSSPPENAGLQDGMLSYFQQQGISTDANADARIASEYFDFRDQLDMPSK